VIAAATRPPRLADVLIRVLPALAAGAALAAAAAIAQAGAHAPAGPALLPDLDQEVPSNLVVTLDGTPSRPLYQLGFRSAVRNVGAGPLVITGSRHDRVDAMVADQTIVHRGSNRELVRGIGRLRYVVNPDHRHWHFLGFEHYELRRPDGGGPLVRDRKTGFCLGDRYAVNDRVLAAKPAKARYRSRCGLGEPGLLDVSEGISVGYGDAYAALLEGQYLPLTGLVSGRYLLVHRVNVDRRIRESDYANDAASVLLDLQWKDGVPHVTEVMACPDSDRCAESPAEPAILSHARAIGGSA
jgi:hypothetical protein